MEFVSPCETGQGEFDGEAHGVRKAKLCSFDKTGPSDDSCSFTMFDGPPTALSSFDSLTRMTQNSRFS